MKSTIRLRALEKKDLRFVHSLNNNRSIMSYWFEEPYESFDELKDLYGKHIHDNTERRFVAEHIAADSHHPESIGLVELIEIDYVHRKAEFQIIIAPGHQGKGHGRTLIKSALDYAFTILNLNKIYLVVAVENEKAIHLYRQTGFSEEGRLRQEYFTNGQYCDALRMYIMQRDYINIMKTKKTLAIPSEVN